MGWEGLEGSEEKLTVYWRPQTLHRWDHSGTIPAGGMEACSGNLSHSFRTEALGARKAARLVGYQETPLQPWPGAHQLLVVMATGLAEP